MAGRCIATPAAFDMFGEYMNVIVHSLRTEFGGPYAALEPFLAIAVAGALFDRRRLPQRNFHPII